MTKSLIFLLVGVVISVFSTLAFILAGSSAAAPFKYVVLAIYAFATVALYFMMARTMALHAVITLGLLTALTSVIAEQILGFCCFPGLVKDLEPLGWEHLQRLSVILLCAMAWYTVVALSAHIVVTKVSMRS